MNQAIRIIRDEHRSIAAVLSGLKSLAHMAKEGGRKPRFEVLRAMIHYIDEFPERLHHPKEDDYLFAHLLRRDEGARPLIEQLQAEHVQGAKLVRELEQALAAAEAGSSEDIARFAAVVDAYAEFHWKHMRAEEHDLIPRAEKALSAQDWAEIETAFAANQDPIADLREQDFAALFQRIVALAPDPVGLGAPWPKASG